ncbi:hypothetical protein HNR44_000631 [Geomicrobium halophilum]|uniref:Uncharacterized protein n=1 Tax=Geomicrobium halophilum TaxID=549000 RepID=A0A841PX74_9BACL|nr:hypothetical protein [Geomicrobium halophilum]
MFITQFVAYFLLFGAIPMLFQSLQVLLGDKKGEDWEYFKGTALLRGFGLSTIWSTIYYIVKKEIPSFNRSN